MITSKGVILFDMILGFSRIVGNAGCLTHCVGSLPKYDIFTIELTNMYFKWAIKLFGNYKKSIMIRKVCWMCYKSVGKFVTMYFIVYLKTRLLNYFKFLIMSFYYYMKGKWCIFILKFISYFKNSMKTFYQSRHIHKIFDLHAFLLNAHRA